MGRQWRALSAALLLTALALASFAMPASAASYNFSNTASITINDRGGGNPVAANPYPSSITVSNVVGAITKVTVTLNGLNHNNASDVDILLRGPGGQAIMLLSDVGSSGNWSNDTITLDDAATNSYTSTSNNLPGGTYRPTNNSAGGTCGSDTQPSPAPAPSITTLAGFNGLSGTSVNGTWSLYITDDCDNDTGGTISGGWSLNITTNAPVAANDSYSTSYRQTLTVAAPGVLGNDTNPLAGALSATLESGPLNGTLSLAADGSFTYTPNQGFTGDDSFTYRAVNSATSSAPATVTISVGSGPFASDMALTVDEDSSVSDLLPAEDGNAEPITFSILTEPLNGVVALTDATTGAFTYTPNPNFNGADSFTFQASDGSTDSNIATVSITVAAVNDAPINTVPGPQNTLLNTALSFSAASSNALSVADVDASGDIQVDLSATGGTLALGDTSGLTSVNGDGSDSVSMLGPQDALNAALEGLVFTPNNGFTGDAELTITTSDLGQTGAGGVLTDTDSILITVGKLTQTITFTNPGPHTYGDAPFELDATASSGLPVSFSVISGPATVSGSTLTITGAGTVTVRAEQTGDATYGAASDDQTFVVAPAALTIKADDKTMVAGSPLPTLTATYTGFVNDDDPSDLAIPVTLSTTATSASPPGDYPIFASGAADTNYTITFVDGTLHIVAADKLAQTITFTNPGPHTYGDAPFSLGATASSGLPVSYTVVSGPATVNGSTLTITGAGTVTVRASQAGDATYAAAPDVERTFVVAPAALTIKADDKTMVAGSPLPTLTATYTGFVNGDDPSDLDTPVTLSTTATSASAPGDYPIVASGAADANYTITFVNGTLHISAAAPEGYTIALPLLAR